MEEKGTFPVGIVNEKGELCREFTLAERTFRHTLQLAADRDIKKELLNDTTYYDAAVISKRLTVAGIDRLTPDQVLDLCGEDGDTLADAIMALDHRRGEFRKTQQAGEKKAGSPP